MPDVISYKFTTETFQQLKKSQFGNDWPVVYLLEDGIEIYIGETISASTRFKQHYENPERKKLHKAYLITDQEYNKSATLDMESWLIQFIAADGKFKLQNSNAGLLNHSYFDREKYRAKFEVVWEKLKEIGLVENDLLQIKNTDLFKYSPYKTLTEEQISIANKIYTQIASKGRTSFVISGKPGTGKSVLAVYLAKFLKEATDTKDINLALVVPMTSLRNTLKKVFSSIKGLKSSMVVGPSEVVGKMYDLLIVDETHRLHRRVNIINYKSFDDSNKLLGLDKQGTELDWIMRSSNSQVFFYDQNQSVRPSDIRHERIKELKAVHYSLSSQLRIIAGEDYIKFVDDIFSIRPTKRRAFDDYELKYYKNLEEMVSKIKENNNIHGLSRLVAGYAWSWKTKQDNSSDYDIELDGLKLKWNSTTTDWVNSKNAINEVGCIHTVQGYDLNYVGVIIGPELSYDKKQNRLVVDKKKYMDINGKRSVESADELEKYVINIYKTLMTRGIMGTYIHAVDKTLEKYLLSHFFTS